MVGIIVVIIIIIAVAGFLAITANSSTTTHSTTSTSSVTASSTPTSVVSTTSSSSQSSSITSIMSSTTTSASSSASTPSTLVIDDWGWPSDDLNQLYSFEGLPWPNWLETVVYQPLITVNQTAEFVSGTIQYLPALASNWTVSANSSVYTLNLRSDVHFSDGNPFNAYQVWTEMYGQYYLSANSSDWWVGGYDLFNMSSVDFGPQTFTLLNQSGLVNPSSAALALMENSSWPIYVTGPYQIVFHLQNPFLFFLGVLVGWDSNMYDCQWLLQNGGFGTPSSINSYFNQHPIPGSGPYDVTQVSENSFVLFTQDPNYWAKNFTASQIALQPFFDPGHVHSVIVYAKTDDVARFADLSSGAAQIASIQAPDWNEVIANPSTYSYLKLPPWLGQMYIMAMNTQLYPTNITDVRLAIVHAINYTELYQQAYLGLASPYVGPSFPWFKEFYDLGNYTPYQFNLTLAQQYMNEANVTGNPTLLMRTYASCTSCLDSAQVIEGDLAQIGLNVNVEVVTADNYWTPIGTYSMMLAAPGPVGQLPLIGGGIAWAPDTIAPTDNWVIFVNNQSLVDNDAIYTTPAVQSCVNSMLDSANLTQIQSFCTTAQSQIYAQAPYDWLGIGDYWLPTGGSLVWKTGVIQSGFLVDPLWGGEDSIPFFNTVQFG
jgi:peptide/nickel transport system substrate-binding protein